MNNRRVTARLGIVLGSALGTALFVLMGLSGSVSLAADQATSSPTTAASSPTTSPMVREGSRGGWWMQRHEAIVERVKKGHVDLLMIGDSITNNYDKHQPPNQDFAPTWDAFYGDRNAVNMGFSGDHTGNVLWRLDHGEVDGIEPKAAVILIGTNNTAGAKQNAEQTIEGIKAVTSKVHEKLPGTKILLMGILPSEVDTPPNKSATDAAVNATLAQFYQGSDFVTYIDIGSIFQKDGKLDWSLFVDPTQPPRNGKKPGPLHPNTQGQRMMAAAIEPTLARLLGDTPHTASNETTPTTRQRN